LLISNRKTPGTVLLNAINPQNKTEALQ
jgi:hypothetical protein